jgi:hypothetical protein
MATATHNTNPAAFALGLPTEVVICHAGIMLAPKGRPLPGTFASGWKHRMDGGWERRLSTRFNKYDSAPAHYERAEPQQRRRSKALAAAIVGPLHHHLCLLGHHQYRHVSVR